jgi:hypothetical protein
LYPIQKKFETGGILGDMDAEEERHFRTFARTYAPRWRRTAYG